MRAIVWTELGLLLLSIGAIAYCISFVQSGAVPSMFARLGLAAGITSAIGILIKLASGFSAVAVIGMGLMIVFEVTFGGWIYKICGSSPRLHKVTAALV